MLLDREAAEMVSRQRHPFHSDNRPSTRGAPVVLAWMFRLLLIASLGMFACLPGLAETANSRKFRDTLAHSGVPAMASLRFTHLTSNDGLSQNNITKILQDKRGFMWFATRDGLNRYDGNTFVVYKNNPDDPWSLSANYIEDFIQDDQGYLWIATHTGGVDKFDPSTERFTHYRHNPNNPKSLGSNRVESILRDSRGYLWIGTQDSGLDKFDPATEIFTHYHADRDTQFGGRITSITEDSYGDIWFVGERGLFHLNFKTGQIASPPGSINGLAADSVYEDKEGNFWMLAWAPIVGLIKYDPRAERMTQYPHEASGGVPNSKILDDKGKGFWVPSSLGLYYFDRQTEHMTLLFHHDDTNPDSLNDDTVAAIYQDRAGVLWVGTENGGLNVLNFQQEQFGSYAHRPGEPNSLSPGAITSIYEDSNYVLWVGFHPRALDRLDRKTGRITHYRQRPGSETSLNPGVDIDAMYKDTRGYLWLGGWAGGGLERFDERTGKFKLYRPDPGDRNSLLSDSILNIYGDRTGTLWVGQFGGFSRFAPSTERLTNYRPNPNDPARAGYSASAIHRDRSGTLWLGTWGGVLSRFDEKAHVFTDYTPDLHDPHKLQGGTIIVIHEDRAGTLWVGAGDGLYRLNRQDQSFTRYTESQGLPSSTIRGILEDKMGRLWLSTKKGISRFDPQTTTFRNYDVYDGLQGVDFSDGCFAQGPDGEMFFGGSKGFNGFYPERIRDNPYVPPVVITDFKIFNKSVPIGDKSVLKKAIPYVNSLALSYRDSVFSFEFAALSYANSQKNRYRYKLENFDRDWSEVGSKQRIATYTNLEPGNYVFRVQGSNSDGVWNKEGTSLMISISPPWWDTLWFRLVCVLLTFGLLGLAYRVRLRQLHHQFEITLDARVNERTRIARDIHDTLLQSFHGLLLRFQTVSELLPDRPAEAKGQLQRAIDRAAEAIAEGRDTVQGLRDSAVETNDLARALSSLGEELAADLGTRGSPAFRVTVEGEPRDLHPIVRDEIYRIAGESLRNAFLHAQARQIELEIRYDSEQIRLRVRDDGKGIDPSVLSGEAPVGHFGLAGMRERAKAIGAKLVIWSEADAGTEVELRVPADAAFTTVRRSVQREQKSSAGS